MQTTSPRAADRLPEQIDFDAIVAQALEDPEVVAGAAAANMSPAVLRADVSLERAFEGARGVLDELGSIEARLRLADAESSAPVAPTRPLTPIARIASVLKDIWDAFRGIFRYGLVNDASSSERDALGTEHDALRAEHDTTLQRVATALSEQVFRDLRSSIERRTADSFSTVLRVDSAPGLAQLVDDDYGIATCATDELDEVFATMPGGSIGLAGRRGSGKSKLIQRFCPPPQLGRDPPLLTTVVSAPTQYDGRDFVLHLFARLCETVAGGPEVRAAVVREEERAAQPPVRPTPGALLARARLPASCLGVAAITAAAFDVRPDVLLIAGAALITVAALLPGPWMEAGHGIIFPRTPSLPLMIAGGALAAGSILGRDPDPLRDAGVIAVAVSVALLLTPKEAFVRRTPAVSRGYSLGPFPEALVTTAHDRLDDIEYQRTIASGWTGGAGAKLAVGPAELSAQGTLSGTRTLARAPLSFPEIVARLRAFLQLAATSAEVRIGIDELDKIESEETAHRFLNEIKGVFGIPRCFFLISVSEEALSNFDRRGTRLRDVFDSSFDEIVHMPPLAFNESIALLRQRVIGLPVPYLALCHVLSGGLPRDLIRVARSVIAAKPDDGDGKLAEITTALVERELEQRVRAVSVVASGLRLEPEASAFLRWARGLAADVPATGLLDACAGREEFTTGSGRALLPADAERVALAQIEELTLELRSLCYFGATLVEYFEGIVGEEDSADAGARWTAPEVDGLIAAAEGLMAARAAASGNPRVGWGLISTFRTDRGITPRTLED
jgi:hypothetical protein